MKLNSPASSALQKIKMKLIRVSLQLNLHRIFFVLMILLLERIKYSILYKKYFVFLIGLGILELLGLTIGVQSLDVSTSAAIQKGIRAFAKCGYSLLDVVDWHGSINRLLSLHSKVLS